jgi:hypothetical protein
MNDGGPAFPAGEAKFNPLSDRFDNPFGMSLRDYFAAKAMHAYLHPNKTKDVVEKASQLQISFSEQIAGRAYEIADAMLEARKAP